MRGVCQSWQFQNFEMEKEPLIEGNSYLESISSNNTDPVDVEQSHTSYFSVIDLENDIATDRVLQLALLLEKSAKQLRHHAKFAEKERIVSPKRYFLSLSFI